MKLLARRVLLRVLHNCANPRRPAGGLGVPSRTDARLRRVGGKPQGSVFEHQPQRARDKSARPLRQARALDHR